MLQRRCSDADKFHTAIALRTISKCSLLCKYRCGAEPDGSIELSLPEDPSHKRVSERKAAAFEANCNA